ncbi:hypothetical protein LF817_17220 [Halobacillus sp. A1]|uniref:hypothetical protein n=1 Tax=Halobacillus sp. A1 TaxID=2880262 RepID=UPI0020A6CC66|nr:hypothetical protein [Halobacillus sp. A1]MCP3033068.1 hypothetical protein [Halobacillus sp. A1]
MIRQRMSIGFLLWVISFFILFYWTRGLLPEGTFFILLVPSILFLLLKDKVSYLLLTIFTIVSSLAFLYMAFVQGWSTADQWSGIGIHGLLLIHLWAMYTFVTSITTLSAMNKKLGDRILELEEYVANTQVLSNREFIKQKEMIHISMVRKREKGFLIYVGLEDLPGYVKDTSFVKVANIIYHSLRKHFDIVGKHDEATVVFLLQSTNSAGLNVVNQRILQKLSYIFTEGALDRISWDIEEIGYTEAKAVQGETSQ